LPKADAVVKQSKASAIVSSLLIVSARRAN
jgi:hypothetical protein